MNLFRIAAKVATPTLYHGSPRGDISEFRSSKPPIFLTTDFDVAKRYAQGDVVGASRSDGSKPVVYEVELLKSNAYDMRIPRHAELYEQLRSKVPGRLPPLEDEGFIQSTGLPNYGTARVFLKALEGTDFDSVYVDEGTQGISIAIMKPENIKIVRSYDV